MCAACREDQFKCDNDRCISAQRVCDGYDSCRDLSDELNCSECMIFPFIGTLSKYTLQVKIERLLEAKKSLSLYQQN